MPLKLLFSVGLIIMTLSMPTEAKAAAITLPLCPNRPNCVSSQAADNDHFIAPFKIKGRPEDAFAALKKALSEQSRTVITEAGDTALHAEATSLIFRFVDDVHAILDADAGVIQIRSASRVGYSDLGVNRRRVEALRTTLQQAGAIE
ncbi:DUF1499 domain-containing protein [Methylomicrobium sp. Wu6]|uniref:DUF1499 domain-containing protein n=1 Tax=Methylomicrobium sp. Wu6 TaxID=3107928 RepID=UPI002DD683B4|nr:DUF1499 domain-containing protein [Methylomicrobium sp. Wu6]